MSATGSPGKRRAREPVARPTKVQRRETEAEMAVALRTHPVTEWYSGVERHLKGYPPLSGIIKCRRDGVFLGWAVFRFTDRIG